MGRHKQKVKVEEDVSCNLIPMIDIMFLLLLFFMLGADMGQRELEEVRLPVASSVKEEKGKQKEKLTVNVYHVYDNVVKCKAYADGEICIDDTHWIIGIRGKDYNKETIKAMLMQEADLDRPEKNGPSERRVCIRADQAALYGFVQRVMNTCAEVKIYKVEIAAAQKMD